MTQAIYQQQLKTSNGAIEKVMRMKRSLCLLAVSFLAMVADANALGGTAFVQEDFEGACNMRFLTCSEPAVYSEQQAVQQGFMKVSRADITTQSENRSHGGVRSFVLNMVVDKNAAGREGAHNRWASTTKLDIPLGKDTLMFLTAFVYPDALPPDIQIKMGVIFNGVKGNDKISGGLCSFPSMGLDPEGWMVFHKELGGFVKSQGFEQVVVTGWQLDITSANGFHGQHVKLFLDDVSIGAEKLNVVLKSDSGENAQTDIGGPHLVGYCSLYKDFPADAINRVKNSSFELGLDSWYTGVSLPKDAFRPGNLKLPDPANTFKIVEGDAVHGNKALEIGRPDGSPNKCILQSMPIPIKDGRPYTLSFYAKSSAPTELRVGYQQQPVKIDTTWKRYDFHFPAMKCESRGVKNFPGRYIIRIIHSGAERILLDAVQMQKGNLSAYQIPGFVAIAVRPDNYDGLYLPDGKPTFKVTLFNGANEKRDATVTCHVQDFMHREIAAFTKSFALKPQTGVDFKAAPPEGYRHYKIIAELDSKGQTPQRAVSAVSVIDDLQNIKGNDFFGTLGLSCSNRVNFKDSLVLNKKLGMGWMMWYNVSQLSQAPDDWRSNDAQWRAIEFHLDNILAYGFMPLVEISPVFPAFAAKDADGIEIVTEREEREVYDWCNALASRLKGKARHYGVFSEYMLGKLGPRAANIRKLLPCAYNGLKAGDPGCVVVACGEDNAVDRAMLTQLEAHFKLGTLQFMDAVSLHPYTCPSGPEAKEVQLQYNELRQLMKANNNGVAKPIWCTEEGYRAVDTLHYDDVEPESLYYPGHVTELEQAERQVRDNVIAFGEGVNRFLTFYVDYDLGFFSFTFIQRENGIRPKTTFPAYAFMVKELSGAAPVKRFEQPENSLMGYFFRKDGELFAIIWRHPKDNKETNSFIQLPSDRLKIFNLVGEEFKPKEEGIDVFDKLWSALPFSADSGIVELPLGGSAFYIHPEGISDEAFMKAIEGIVVDKLSMKLAMKDARTLQVKLSNSKRGAALGKLELTSDDGAMVPAHEFSLAPGESKAIAFALPKPTSSSRSIGVKLSGTAKGEFASELKMLFVERAPAASRLKAGFPDYAAVAPVNLGPKNQQGSHTKYSDPKDLSAELRLLQDDDNLYVAISARDDIHSNPAPHDSLWLNDAVQLGFGIPGKPGLVEMNFCLTKNGAAASLSPLQEKGADISKVREAIRRDGNVTNYEITIPWMAFGNRVDVNNVKFNIAICDNDGIDKNGNKLYKQLELTSGIVDVKDTSSSHVLVPSHK